MSVRGIRVRYIALALSLIAIIAGIFITFVQSSGFKSTTAVITSVKELPKDFEEDETPHEVYVKYTVDGREYTGLLDYYSPSFKEGKTVKIKYDPKDPSVIHAGQNFGIYLIIAGAVVLAITLISMIAGRTKLKKLKETENVGKDAVYAPSVQGEERELYFLTDLGTPKYGHRLEDAGRNVLYEAKMTKYTLSSPFGFDFIDHAAGTKKAHLVGHEEASEWSMLLLDNNYTFKFDGEDIWKHLKRNGISVDSGYGAGSGKLIGVNYRISRDGVEIARAKSTGKYVHEDEAEEHSKAMNAVPVHGFYRVWTREQDLGLLFVTLVAFARTEATDDRGGTYKTILGTLKNQD